MAAASRAVRTSGRVAIVLVEGPARPKGTVGEEDLGGGGSPGSGAGVHGCSWAGGAVAGGRSARASAVAGVGRYLDPAPRCGVFWLVEGLIVQLWSSRLRSGDRAAGSAGDVVVVATVGNRSAAVARTCEHAAVVPG